MYYNRPGPLAELLSPCPGLSGQASCWLLAEHDGEGAARG